MENIELIKIEDFEVGFERLKRAKLELSGDRELYEYKNATFALENLRFSQINPSTFYALQSHLDFQRNLAKLLLQRLSIDLFNPPGIIYFKLDEELHGLVPPIIEIYEELDGKNNYALQDGVHRLLLAKELNIAQKCIVITNKNSNKDYLPYAFTNTWEEVSLCKEIPQTKKKYRREPKYSFMRPLQSIFDSKLVSDWAEYGR